MKSFRCLSGFCLGVVIASILSWVYPVFGVWGWLCSLVISVACLVFVFMVTPYFLKGFLFGFAGGQVFAVVAVLDFVTNVPHSIPWQIYSDIRYWGVLIVVCVISFIVSFFMPNRSEDEEEYDYSDSVVENDRITRDFRRKQNTRNFLIACLIVGVASIIACCFGIYQLVVVMLMQHRQGFLFPWWAYLIEVIVSGIIAVCAIGMLFTE